MAASALRIGASTRHAIARLAGAKFGPMMFMPGESSKALCAAA